MCRIEGEVGEGGGGRFGGGVRVWWVPGACRTVPQSPSRALRPAPETPADTAPRRPTPGLGSPPPPLGRRPSAAARAAADMLAVPRAPPPPPRPVR